MATTTDAPAFALDSKGGLPTGEEWGAIWSAIIDIDQEALDPAFRRVVRPLIEAYESETGGRLDWTYEELGVYSARTDAIVEACEWLLARARKLQDLRETVGEVLWNGGSVEVAPPFDVHGGEYVPSREALERFGLVAEVERDDAS